VASVKNVLVDYIVSTSCLAQVSGLPSGLSVRRGGLIPSTSARQPEMLVYVGPEVKWQPVGIARYGNPILRAFTLIVEIRANGAVGVAPDEVLDPLEVWAETQLFAASANTTFRGLGATGIIGWRTEQDARQADLGYFVETIYADLEYTTQRGLPESRGDA
jgi:hypothetical protein